MNELKRKDPRCKWCRCSLPIGVIVTCLKNPNGLFCEREVDDTRQTQGGESK